MQTHVQQVTESANGQKTVTVPKDADIEDGDYTKFRETEELEDAVDTALDELDDKFSFDDPMKTDGVCDYTYLCGHQEQSQQEPCFQPFATESELKDHFDEVHEDTAFDADKHIIEVVRVQRMFLGLLVKHAIQHLDLKNPSA